MNLKTIFKEAWEKTFVSSEVRKRNLEDFIDNLPDNIEVNVTDNIEKHDDKREIVKYQHREYNLCKQIEALNIEIKKYQRREDEHCRQIDEMDKRRVIIGWRTLEKINREMAESGCPSCLLTPDEYGFI